MNRTAVLYPGDRPNFVEGWHDLRDFRGPVDLEYLAVQSLCRLEDLAQQAIDKLGYSYRAFKVGAAVLALDEPGSRTGIYFGGNFTPYQGAEWNCAEKRAVETVQANGFNRVLAVAVSGPLQVDASGLESPTLHPCHKCRAMFQESELFASDTLVATSSPDAKQRELFTRDSLINLHATHQPQPFPSTHPLLPFYWDQIRTFDVEQEKAELAILSRMAQS